MRLTFEITEEVHKKLCIIPHGLRKYAYAALVENFVKELEARPGETIQALMMHKLVIRGLEVHGPRDNGGPATPAISPAQRDH